jgi:hypothetical protein
MRAGPELSASTSARGAGWRESAGDQALDDVVDRDVGREVL